MVCQQVPCEIGMVAKAKKKTIDLDTSRQRKPDILKITSQTE